MKARYVMMIRSSLDQEEFQREQETQLPAISISITCQQNEMRQEVKAVQIQSKLRIAFASTQLGLSRHISLVCPIIYFMCFQLSEDAVDLVCYDRQDTEGQQSLSHQAHAH